MHPNMHAKTLEQRPQNAGKFMPKSFSSHDWLAPMVVVVVGGGGVGGGGAGGHGGGSSSSSSGSCSGW